MVDALVSVQIWAEKHITPPAAVAAGINCGQVIYE
jgi:hypothetical protein